MTQPVFDLPEVQGLRFRGRHVSQTIASYVRQSLSARGWGDRDKPITDPVNQSLNFGSEQPLWYISTLPEFVDPAKVTTNMVAITLGDEGEDELEQLGGGLYSVTYPLTVDIYGETASGSLSIVGAAEHSAWWSRLSERERVEYRNKVLGSLNTYHDFMLDVISVGDEDPHSQQVIQLLEAVHSSQLRLERQTVPHG
jgi:hypothetical protein